MHATRTSPLLILLWACRQVCGISAGKRLRRRRWRLRRGRRPLATGGSTNLKPSTPLSRRIQSCADAVEDRLRFEPGRPAAAEARTGVQADDRRRGSARYAFAGAWESRADRDSEYRLRLQVGKDAPSTTSARYCCRA